MNIYNYTHKNIEVIGDLHCSLYDYIKNISNTDTLFIFVGDLNIGELPFEDDIDLLIKAELILANQNNSVTIIRGNHDNPKYFKHNSYFNQDLLELCPHILLVQDYSIIQCNDKNILCIGGARSIDKIDRILDYNYWKNECVYYPYENFYDDLQESGIKITTIITHTAPLFSLPVEFTNESKYYDAYLMNSYALYDNTLKADVFKDREILSDVYNNLKKDHNISLWIHGHYHKSMEKQYGKLNIQCLNIKENYKLQ